jgi:hypothetical protein
LSAKDSLVTWSPAVDQSAISRAVTVGGGRFAPGHLGELTQQVPFEMVNAVLEQTCRVHRRVRVLLSAHTAACERPGRRADPQARDPADDHRKPRRRAL